MAAPQDWDALETEVSAASSDQWLWLKQMAIAHGLTGIVARNLAWAEHRLHVAIPVAAELAAARRAQLPRLLARQAGAREAADALLRAGITPILFKGPAVAVEIYGDLSLRGFGDSDILVEAEQYDAASALLQKLGYEISWGSVDAHREGGDHAAEFKRGDNKIELHWELSGAELRPEDSEIIWKNTCAGPEHGLPGLRLTPAMNIVFLATHFYWHNYRAFKPMLDTYLVGCSAGEALDAGQVIGVAKALDRLEIVKIAARFCERHFPSLPVFAAIAAMPIGVRGRLACQLYDPARLLSPNAWNSHGDSRNLRIAIANSMRSAVEGLRMVFWPRPEHLAQRFGRPYRLSLYPIYYVRQARRLITRSTTRFNEVN